MKRAGALLVVGMASVLWLLTPAEAQSPAEGDLYDCSDFQYQEDAQKVFDQHPGDPYGLDGPIGPAYEGKKGVACEDLPHRPDSGGAATDQYGSNTQPANPSSPRDVIPGTAVSQMPNTGGPPYLIVSALALLGTALIVGRGILRR